MYSIAADPNMMSNSYYCEVYNLQTMVEPKIINDENHLMEYFKYFNPCCGREPFQDYDPHFEHCCESSQLFMLRSVFFFFLVANLLY